MKVTELSQQTEMKEAYKFVEKIILQSVCPLYSGEIATEIAQDWRFTQVETTL